MTIAEITRHSAGAELDRLVHERVMGYIPREEGGWWSPDRKDCPACFSYSTSPAWSLIVAETLVATYHPKRWTAFGLHTVRTENGRGWHAMFRRDDETAWAEGGTPEEAICLAAVIAAVVGDREAATRTPTDAVAELRKNLWGSPGMSRLPA